MPRAYSPLTSKLPGIRLVANELTRLGIPFYEEKKSSIVCFGLVRLTIKYSKFKLNLKYPYYEFHTTPNEKRTGLNAHLVVLVCDRATNIGFYIFDAHDPVFYISKGRLKRKWGYFVSDKPYDGTNSLTQWKMAENANRFDRIETTLQRLLAEQKAATVVQPSAVEVRFGPPAQP